jgi:hypothetical protein
MASRDEAPVQALPHTSRSPSGRGMVGVIGTANTPNSNAKHATQANDRRRFCVVI